MEERVKEILREYEVYKIIYMKSQVRDAGLDKLATAICQLDSKVCPRCHGEGTIPKEQDDEERKERHIAYTSVTCPTCHGIGQAKPTIRVRRLTEDEVDSEQEKDGTLMPDWADGFNCGFDYALKIIRQLNPDVEVVKE